MGSPGAEARKEDEGFDLGLWNLKGHRRENMQKTDGYVGLKEEREKIERRHHQQGAVSL